MNDKIKELLENAEKTDSLAKLKWRIENREQLRKERKEKLKELMEKDKQQTAVKLYTQEQLERGMDLANRNVSKKSILESLTPLELPSDDEINEMGIDVIIYNDTKRGWFVEGLKFMRDKIQGGQQ
jgi:polyphosphate kinase